MFLFLLEKETHLCQTVSRLKWFLNFFFFFFKNLSLILWYATHYGRKGAQQTSSRGTEKRQDRILSPRLVCNYLKVSTT